MMNLTTKSILAAGALTLATALTRVAAAAPTDPAKVIVSGARGLTTGASTAPHDDDSGDSGDTDDSGDESD